MDSHKRSPLIALPFIAIALLVAGMTQRASAAYMPSINGATTGVTAIDRLLDRVAERAAERMNDVDQDEDDDEDTRNEPNDNDDARRRAIIRRRSSIRASALFDDARPATRPAAPADTADENATDEVFRLVNEARAAEGLPAYGYNRILEQSAEDYSEHMRGTDCFSHTACGSTLKQRMHASGYYRANGRSYSYGENIARGQDSAEEVMEDWMNSRSHRAAILSTKFKEIGIGRSGEYWTQHFGAVR